MYKRIDLNKLIVIDIETIKNCAIFCCLDVKTNAKKEFIFYDSPEYKEQPFEFWKFLRSCVNSGYSSVTFNGLGFDMQVLDDFYNACLSTNTDKLYEFPITHVIDVIYNKSQEIISIQNQDDRFKYLTPEHKLFMPTIDLFKQLHYDRPAKYTSLKWVEFSMQYPTIQEMPIDHSEDVNKEDVASVVEYCWNDVLATKQFYTNVSYETEVRHKLGEEYKLNLINASEPKMAKDIFAKYLCPEMDITYQDLKKLKTIEGKITLKEVVFPYIKFLTPALNEVLQVINNTTIDISPQSKDKFSYSFNYYGNKVDLGLGGIHSCIKSGVYQPQDDEVILDLDVTSFYPMLAIQNNLKPKHLGDVFCKVYNNIFLERKKYDKKDPRNYILKICLNSTYGLSSEINSYLYDRRFTYSITINGQLTLLMLIEAIYKGVPEVTVLQKNTDGFTIIIKKEYVYILDKIRKWWQDLTKLQLEEAYYSKMIIMDVNNYIAVGLKGEVKKKGLFETVMPYHKNPSALIIPKALENYFINNLTPKEYITNKENSIFDFCLAVKKKGSFKLNLLQNYEFAELIKEQQKVCRYIISKPNSCSGILVKDFEDGRRIQVEANTHVEPLDVICTAAVNDYKINYDWYIKKTYEIINKITPPVIQQQLF